MAKVKQKDTIKKQLATELHQELMPILANLKLVLDEKQFKQNLKDAVKALVRGAATPKEVKTKKDKKRNVATNKKRTPQKPPKQLQRRVKL